MSEQVELSPRERIIEAAARHFATRAFEAVSMQEVADEAEVNRGLIHYYIGNKRALYLEVLRSALHVPQIPALSALRPDDDFYRMIERSVDAWLGDLETRRDEALMILQAWYGTGRDPEVDQMVHEAREEAIDVALGTLFEDPADAPAELRGLMSSIGGLAASSVLEWLRFERLRREQVRVLLVEATMFALQAAPAVVSAAPLRD